LRERLAAAVTRRWREVRVQAAARDAAAERPPATIFRNSSSLKARKVSELTFPFEPSASAALAATVSSGASTRATMS
jgi:hypothetical protein